MILKPGNDPEEAPPHPDGRPLWTFRYWSWEDRDHREALTDDPRIVEWLSELRHSDNFTAESEDVPDRPGVPLVRRFHPLVNRAASVSPGPNLDGFAPRPAEGPLADWAMELRGYLEAEGWPDFHNAVAMEANPPPDSCPSIGMCGVTTALAVKLLQEADPEGDWTAGGGHPTVRYPKMASQFKAAHADLDGGMWDRERERWDGHYWLNGTHAGEPVILDLTGDQYGWDPVIITGVDDPRYRANYRPAQIKKDQSFPGKCGDWVRRHEGRLAALDLPSPVADLPRAWGGTP